MAESHLNVKWKHQSIFWHARTGSYVPAHPRPYVPYVPVRLVLTRAYARTYPRTSSYTSSYILVHIPYMFRTDNVPRWDDFKQFQKPLRPTNVLIWRAITNDYKSVRLHSVTTTLCTSQCDTPGVRREDPGDSDTNFSPCHGQSNSHFCPRVGPFLTVIIGFLTILVSPTQGETSFYDNQKCTPLPHWGVPLTGALASWTLIGALSIFETVEGNV
jgi:hypothetical protein